MENKSFRDQIFNFCRNAGRSMEELANELGVNQATLGRKLRGKERYRLTLPELKKIIKTLILWEVITYQSQVQNLLEAAGFSKDHYSLEDWQSYSLTKLKIDQPVVNLSANLINKSSINHNLPTQFTSFTGRAQDVASICNRLLRADTRLITLTGAGGIGKTRLSLEVAFKILEDFGDGVYFIPLAVVNSSHFVPNVIATTLGIKEKTGEALLETMKKWLEIRRILLILDNFEHLPETALLVKELLNYAPNLKILITSRAVLHIYGENEYIVPPLALPDPNNLPDLPTLLKFPAIQLFIDRSQAHKSAFNLTNENSLIVAKICARLDGLPLAIELAAARIKFFPLQTIYERLDQMFKLLVGGPRDLLPRQQSLWTTIDWSYNLLSDAEQLLFYSLSIFEGNWGIVEAEEIASILALKSPVLDLIISLVDKSLAQKIENDRNETRFVLLGTIRNYAREKLKESGAETKLRQKLTLYYLKLTGLAENEFRGARQEHWFNQIEMKYSNIRAVLTWEIINGDTTTALALATSLGRFWKMRGYLSEGRQFLEQSLAAVENSLIPIKAKAFLALGDLTCSQGDFNQAKVLFEQAVSFFREMNELQGEATSLHSLGELARQQGNFNQATNYYAESLTLNRKSGNRLGIADSLLGQGLIKTQLAEYETARVLLQESLGLMQQLENKQGIADALLSLGNLAFYSQNLDEAKSCFEECLGLFKELGNTLVLANCLNNLAAIASWHSENEHAKKLLEEALLIKKELGDKHGVAVCLVNLGAVAVDLLDFIKARLLILESLELFCEAEDWPNVQRALELLALVAIELGEFELAIMSLAVIKPLANNSLGGDLSAEAESNLKKAQLKLGDSAFQNAWDYGQNLSLRQAIAQFSAEKLLYTGLS